MNMQFLNLSSNVPNAQSNKINTPPQNTNIPNMFMRRRFVTVQPSPPPPKPQVIPQEPKPKMIWGAPIWFLFHTLAEKVKEEEFHIIRTDLLNNIYAICVNLPCPICSTHAKEYMDHTNFNTIRTKSDLKNMLFQFHNEVNKRKGYSLYPLSELDEKYSKAITVNIIQNFMIHFQDKHRSPKLIASDLQRTRIAMKLKEWFQQNIIHFD